MFLSLLKLVMVRGAGVAIYTASAIYALPESNVISSILVLSIIDFLAGMLYPTFKTAVVSGRVDIELVFGMSIVISVILLSASYFIYPNILLISFVLYLIVVAIFPYIVKAGSLFESKDVGGHIKLEAFVSFVSAISASVLLIAFKIFNFDLEFSTPILRNFFYFVVCVICYIKRGFLAVEVKPRLSFDIKALVSFVGVEYLMLFSVFRAKILYLISSDINFQGSVKLISLLYDPVSVFYGYFLRSTFAKAGFKSIEYFIRVWPVFFITLCVSFVFAGLIFVSDVFNLGLIISVVALLLCFAGLTTNYIVGHRCARLSYILVYVFGLIWFEYYENLTIGLIGISLSLMLIISMQRNGRV